HRCAARELVTLRRRLDAFEMEPRWQLIVVRFDTHFSDAPPASCNGRHDKRVRHERAIFKSPQPSACGEIFPQVSLRKNSATLAEKFRNSPQHGKIPQALAEEFRNPQQIRC